METGRSWTWAEVDVAPALRFAAPAPAPVHGPDAATGLARPPTGPEAWVGPAAAAAALLPVPRAPWALPGEAPVPCPAASGAWLAGESGARSAASASLPMRFSFSK